MLEAFATHLAAQNPLAMGVGLAGTLAAMSWPLFRRRQHLLTAQLVANLCFAVHYFLIGANTGGLMNTLSAAQVALAIPLGARPGFRRFYLGALPVVALAVALSWSWPASLFASMGVALVSVARYQTDVMRLRLGIALALPFWFAHNLTVHSIPGLIADVVSMSLNLAMLVRLRREAREKALGGMG